MISRTARIWTSYNLVSEILLILVNRHFVLLRITLLLRTLCSVFLTSKSVNSMMSTINNTTLLPLKTIKVPHLGGIGVSYSLPNGPIKSSKPTLIFINGYSGNAHRFRAQVDDPQLAAVANLLVLEPLGHGGTNTNAPAFTLWDAAWAFSQALDALNVQKYSDLRHEHGGIHRSEVGIVSAREGKQLCGEEKEIAIPGNVLTESRCLVWS